MALAPSSQSSYLSKLVWAGLIAATAGVILYWRMPGSDEHAQSSAAPDPRLTYSTRFRNVRPDVQYIGDEACAKCHRQLATCYRDHPMGRSFLPVSQATKLEKYDAASHNPFTTLGMQYAIKPPEEDVLHTETRLRPDGAVLASKSHQVQYVMGSGSQGRSYVLDQDGYLLQSPIAWYRRTAGWDLAPGFDEMDRQYRFERKIDSRCLFCHVNRVEPVANTLNRYHAPVFRGRGYSIGCERCHGPGELHARFRKSHEEPVDVDETIVNPRHLEPALREAVCQQCHLDPDIMVLRRGREPFDYRPGLPLHLFWSMFVKKSGRAEHAFVSQVDQMYVSRCFQASNGKLGCISCHDPHEMPAGDKKVDFYRRRCLECHEKQGCSLPIAEREAKAVGDNCIQCHMPQRNSKDINHTWLSDHRIPRMPAKAEPSHPSRLPEAGESPLVLFHENLIEPDHRPELQRDLGIALAEAAGSLHSSHPKAMEVAANIAGRALPLLEPGLAAWPDDVPAYEAKALALTVQGRHAEALPVFEMALKLAPEREFALSRAAKVAIELGQYTVARDYLQRAIAINPWDASYHADLARCLAIAYDWPQTIQQCQKAIDINPFRHEPRKYLVAAYLATGNRKGAREEFESLLGLNPPDADALRRWFAEQTK